MAAHGDESHVSNQDLTTAYLAKVEKGRNKTAIQVTAISKAYEQLRLVAESPTYAVTGDQWDEIFSTIEEEHKNSREHVARQAEKRSRRGQRYTWHDGKLIKEHV